MKLLLAFVALLNVYAADLPSGEALLQRSLERSGGSAAFAKIHNAEMSGTVEMVGHNLSGPVTIYQSGDRSYTVIDLPGIGKVEEGYDGKVAWEMNSLQGARVKDAEEAAVVKRASKINLLGTWKDIYKSARTVGSEDIEGKPAWKVELTPKEGKVETFFFDKQSGLLVRISMTIPTALGEIPVDMSMTDFRPVAGVQTPFSMTQKAMSQTLTMHFDKVLYNADIPPDKFELPAAVKAVAAKSKN